jgi:hypothetical protein
VMYAYLQVGQTKRTYLRTIGMGSHGYTQRDADVTECALSGSAPSTWRGRGAHRWRRGPRRPTHYCAESWASYSANAFSPIAVTA